MDAKNKRTLSLVIVLVTGLLLIGILPQFGISLTFSLFGAINLGLVLGLGQLAVAWYPIKNF